MMTLQPAIHYPKEQSASHASATSISRHVFIGDGDYVALFETRMLNDEGRFESKI